MTTDFRVYTVTWNLAEVGPPKDFTRLLCLDARVLPDVYAVGLQEAPSSVISDTIYDDEWTKSLTDCLHKKNYVRVKAIKLVGICLIVFVKRANLPLLSNIETQYTKTGLGGLYGNKGAVTIRMDISGINVCFLNCHLTAHLPNMAERIDDHDMVIDGQHFKDSDAQNILEHDYIFWFGDLNFRLDDIPIEDVKKIITDGDYHYLFQFDQLKKLMQEDVILPGFREGAITFPPTYKYDQGTDVYDTSKKQRKPGWCDRILYRVDQKAFDGVELAIDQLSYTSLQEYRDSDHKPVIAEFIIQVLRYPPEQPVMFEPIDVWCTSRDKECVYTVSSSLSVSSWDWIGIYKADFRHPRDYQTYVWASTKGEDMRDETYLYNIKFDKDYLKKLSPGQYCLCYYSSRKDCIVGYSSPFKLSLTEDQSDSSSSEGEGSDSDGDSDLELLETRLRPKTARGRPTTARARSSRK